MSRHAPLGIPKTVARFAVANEIPLRLVRTPLWDDWYYEAGNDMTRTSRPKACHALALCRRYLSSRNTHAHATLSAGPL